MAVKKLRRACVGGGTTGKMFCYKLMGLQPGGLISEAWGGFMTRILRYVKGRAFALFGR